MFKCPWTKPSKREEFAKWFIHPCFRTIYLNEQNFCQRSSQQTKMAVKARLYKLLIFELALCMWALRFIRWEWESNLAVKLNFQHWLRLIIIPTLPRFILFSLLPPFPSAIISLLHAHIKHSITMSQIITSIIIYKIVINHNRDLFHETCEIMHAVCCRYKAISLHATMVKK